MVMVVIVEVMAMVEKAMEVVAVVMMLVQMCKKWLPIADTPIPPPPLAADPTVGVESKGAAQG
jgi:hypothetical protein